MSVNYKPLNGRVLVLPIKESDKEHQVGSIVVVEKAPDEGSLLTKASVVAISDGKESHTATGLVEHKVKVGDTVFFPTQAGSPVKFDLVDYISIHEYEIMGVSQ